MNSQKKSPGVPWWTPRPGPGIGMPCHGNPGKRRRQASSLILYETGEVRKKVRCGQRPWRSGAAQGAADLMQFILLRRCKFEDGYDALAHAQWPATWHN